MKNWHALLVGLAAAVLTAVLGWLGHFDPTSVTANPILVAAIGAAVGVLSRLIGVVLSKIGSPPPQTLAEAEKVVAQYRASQAKIASVVILALLLSPAIEACTKANASPVVKNAKVTATAAPGDTINVASSAKLTGAADSVMEIISDSGSVVHFKPDTIIWRAPVPTQLLVSRAYTAVPAYAVNVRSVIRFRWWAFKDGVKGPQVLAFAAFTPIGTIPPGTITVDSVRVIPSMFQVYPRDTINVQVFTFLSDGRVVMSPRRAVAALKPGRHYFVAIERSEVGNAWGQPGDVLPAGAHSDTVWYDVNPGGRNEPAGFVTFAKSNGDTLPLPYPKKVINRPGWMGAWSQYPVPDADLTLKPQDLDGMGQVIP